MEKAGSCFGTCGFAVGIWCQEFFASFPSGIERPVKTWQSSIGVPETSIMTAELLQRLFIDQQDQTSGSKAQLSKVTNECTNIESRINCNNYTTRQQKTGNQLWLYLSPFMILIIAILNDSTIMMISTDRVKPSRLLDLWRLNDQTGIQ
ncbi:hypothetical protein M8C21_005913 [Ambrosia artemisiifolia]|uniref:Uncharacterized protein n=1 Tax=Ambrosia artemisiifolia TaxID=4212 RepID=A0AAD5GBB0_AMBAR|nr:hypothetical protein M8C21_005913 [Ambrosia artemisiifolia]